MTTLPRYTATRYVQPLREGGSLPAVVDTENGLFVTKFRGAGQGAKALIAELIVGLLARELGLPVPELALIEVVSVFGRSEPDPEIQEILRASHGTNVGIRYLDGAFNFDGYAAGDFITAEFASNLVWFDALLTNPDRTHRNPNLLIWERKPWLIDHGSALYAQHTWGTVDDERTRSPFPLIKDHVLLAHANDVIGADTRLAHILTDDVLRAVLATVPDDLLMDPISGDFSDPESARARYHEYLSRRLAAPRSFVAAAIEARATRAAEPPRRRSARR
jgi:HipA-like kinase